jgi:D-beta-D-heptose 7-phosphate kinase/D-beta-D-heptose 1-phosphate adenosyltransferase
MKMAKKKKFCVVGDMIVDHYRVLEATRISPEAPVLIFGLKAEYRVPGGAGNVANNLMGLAQGGDEVVLCTIVGRDWDETVGEGFLPCRKVLVENPRRRTTVKERLVTNRQQVARIDLQETGPQDRDLVAKLCGRALKEVRTSDAVVLSDYNHGVMSHELTEAIISEARKRGVPVVVDSKAPDTLWKYRGSTIALPTKQEIMRFEGITKAELSMEDGELARTVLDKMGLEAVGMTMGKDGIFLAVRNGEATRYPALAEDPENDVVDVTGAGDTVTATVALGMAHSLSFAETIRLANVAAGTVVLKSGVVAASRQEVERIARSMGIFWPKED